MYKTYSVTKKQIIEAVLTEPLISDNFLDYFNRNDKNCGVCAVGAVLRHVGLSNDEISDNATEITEYKFCVADLEYDKDLYTENFLSILSMHHEYFAANYNDGLNFYPTKQEMNLQRFHLLNVIEAFCPKVVTFKVFEAENV